MIKIKFYALAERFNNRRLDLTINPTLACNFACPYCFEEDHRNIYMSENTENEINLYLLPIIPLQILQEYILFKLNLESCNLRYKNGDLLKNGVDLKFDDIFYQFDQTLSFNIYCR